MQTIRSTVGSREEEFAAPRRARSKKDFVLSSRSAAKKPFRLHVFGGFATETLSDVSFPSGFCRRLQYSSLETSFGGLCKSYIENEGSLVFMLALRWS
jgi:hypothetical protein